MVGFSAHQGGSIKVGRMTLRESGVYVPKRTYFKEAGVWKRLYANNPLITTITELGLTTGLELVLDPGDIASIPSNSATQWIDTGPNATNFNRGTTTGAEASDPTIIGTPGNLDINNYMLLDGGDWLTITANTAFYNQMHVNNGRLSFGGYVYATAAFNGAVFGNNGGATTSGTGCHLHIVGNALRFTVCNASASVFNQPGTLLMPDNAWSYVGLTVDEANNRLTFYVNDQKEDFACTYVSPAAGPPSYATQIGARGNGNGAVINGARFGHLTFSYLAWTDAQHQMLFQATRDRYGI